MKRITIVTDAWEPQINGVVVVLRHLIPALERNGYEVTVIHPGLFRFRVSLPTYPEIKLALCAPGRMRRLLNAAKPDHVHVMTEGPLGFMARRACLRNGLSFTTSYETQFPLYAELRLRGLAAPSWRYLRWFHGAAARTMVPTESIRAELRAHGFRNLAIWPRGVDTDLFKPSKRGSEGLARPCFVYVGRLAVEKNVEEFLRLDLPGSKLVIGDGPDRERLESRYGERARFVGYKTGQELVDAISCGDVFVCPSRTETFGLTVVEALACGVPVAAHDAAGPRDILSPGIDGIIGDDLKQAALACLPLAKDACRTKALHYSWDRSASIFESHITPARA
jgi:glycosyltransferase involved in cell wall biosynthesis